MEAGNKSSDMQRIDHFSDKVRAQKIGTATERREESQVGMMDSLRESKKNLAGNLLSERH